MKFLCVLLIAVLDGNVVCTAEAVSAQRAQASCPADAELAYLVAEAPVILVARMDMRRPADAKGYLDIPLKVDSVVKGEGEVASLRFYTKDTSSGPSNEAVLGLADAPALLFLTRVEDRFYFAGYSPRALGPASEDAVVAARAETARQADILRTWQAAPSLPKFKEVRFLIKRLGRVKDEEQQRVFEQLEALGSEAVPAIVAQMDDRRPLKTEEISLANHSPGAFEGMRHYGPELVVDGLDALLNQITGRFGNIVNGGTDSERDAAVAGWRVYAAGLACHGDPFTQ